MNERNLWRLTAIAIIAVEILALTVTAEAQNRRDCGAPAFARPSGKNRPTRRSN